jgi:hypothetical protein
LIANLLFSQVVINLLHDPHDFHQPVSELQQELHKQGKATVQEHGEHCKVCSLDILFNILPNPSTILDFSVPKVAAVIYAHVEAGQSVLSFSKDRAPPILVF